MHNYKSVGYANDRLANTISCVDGIPALIHKITEKKVQYQPLNEVNFKLDIKVADVDKLDINPVPLGYCNQNGDAFYLMRMPLRKDWKQGLRIQNFIVLYGGEEHRSSIVRYEFLHDTVLGKYPKFGEVYELAKNKKLPRSIAWSRQFAVYNDGSIRYKEQVVIGKLDLKAKPEHGVVDIAKNMEWVLEELEGSIEW